FRRGHGAGDAFLHARQRVDEVVHRRTCAHAYHLARLDVLERGAPDHGFEFVLSHLRQFPSVPVSSKNYPMALLPYGLSRAVLFNMDPEAAHDLTIDLLARGAGTPLQWTWCHSRIDDPVTLAGLALPNRVGLA